RRRIHQLDAGLLQLTPHRGVRGGVHGSREVPQEYSAEPSGHGIVRAPLHAVVPGQSTQVDAPHPTFSQVTSQPGGRAFTRRVPVVTESAVRVRERIASLAYHGWYVLPGDAFMQLRAARASHAV